MLICLKVTDVLAYPQGGGHAWAYYNWALGFQALGCEVMLMDNLPGWANPSAAALLVEAFAANAEKAGLRGGIAVLFPDAADAARVPWEAAAEGSDLLVNFHYTLAPEVLARFRRTALVDIDPGLTQVWMTDGGLPVAPHDAYFTTGETVGMSGSDIPDCGLRWHYTPPPVHLAAWPATSPAPRGAPFTTVSNWWGEWVRLRGECFENSKAVGFADYLDLPARTSSRLELALSLADDSQRVRQMLEAKGWSVQDAWERVPTPAKYLAYIQSSRGEFSCAKPSYLRLRNAWVSDRTLCYLASGRPAVVQHTGESRILPDRAGLLRFRTPAEASEMLGIADADPAGQGRLARQLAEEHFDSVNVCRRFLERAMT